MDGQLLFEHAGVRILPIGHRVTTEGPRGRFTEYEVDATSVGTDLRLRFVRRYGK